MAKANFYTVLGIYIVGGVFTALLIGTLPSPYRQIAFGFVLLVGAALWCAIALPSL